MNERTATAFLKQRFEAAGFQIVENVMFEEGSVRFEMDGFDRERRVGYEYVTREAGDDWDVDADVVAALAERRERGELSVLVISEDAAPDEAALRRAVDEFLGTLPAATPRAQTSAKPPATPKAKKPPATPKKAAAKPAAKPAAKKPPKPPKR